MARRPIAGSTFGTPRTSDEQFLTNAVRSYFHQTDRIFRTDPIGTARATDISINRKEQP